MSERTFVLDGVEVPRFLYGTAWKEDATEPLVAAALEAGFRGIDAANQRRHYYEEGVGKAVAAARAAGSVTRDELFLQTKFTFRGGQDHRLPYDPLSPVAQQVADSFASSLVHLGVERIDSYVLHGPSTRDGLAADDLEAWQAMEALHAAGKTRFLGVSNVSLGQLQQLTARARVKPRFVQNRCYASRAWDRGVRRFCQAEGIVYQGFSLLTANREVLAHPTAAALARRYGRTVEEVVFRFALDVGMLPLTGTTDPGRMRLDLSVFDFQLEPAEVQQLETLLVS